MVAEGLHGEYTNSLFDCDRHDLISEGAEVRVHHVNRHLYGVEMETVLLSDLQHAEMDGRVFVAGKSYIADFYSLAGCHGRFDGAARGEDAVGVLHANDFVKLHEVDHVGLEPAE